MTTFSDDFNRADGSPGANWVQVSGTWSIISQQLSSGNAGGTIILRAATAMATNDHSVQITIAATAAVSHGVWARGNSNITSGYLLRNDGSTWNLFSVVGGSFSSIGSYAAAAVAGDVVKLQAVGSTIKGFINGAERISVTDSAVATGTSVGVRAESTSSLRFDDFSAADITTTVTGDAALSGTATLSTTGLRAATGGASLAGTASLAADGTRAASADTAIAATAPLAASGAVTASGDAALTAAAALTASGQRTTAGDAAFTSAAALTATGQRDTTAPADLAATAALAADGVRNTQADAALTATAALAASGQTTPAGNATLTAAAALTAAGNVASVGNAALAATAALTASGTTISTRDDIDVTVGAPYSPWSAGGPQAGDWKVGAPW